MNLNLISANFRHLKHLRGSYAGSKHAEGPSRRANKWTEGRALRSNQFLGKEQDTWNALPFVL